MVTLKHLLKESELARAKLIQLGKQTKEFKYIRSIYGIGDQSASQLIAELGDMSRFRNYKQINAYCGLEPSIYQLGQAFFELNENTRDLSRERFKMGRLLNQETLFQEKLYIQQ